MKWGLGEYRHPRQSHPKAKVAALGGCQLRKRENSNSAAPLQLPVERTALKALAILQDKPIHIEAIDTECDQKPKRDESLIPFARAGLALTSLVVRAAVAAGLIFAGCATAPRPPEDPSYCSSYDSITAWHKGQADALNEPSRTKPCPQECSRCVASYSDGYSFGLQQAEAHRCAVARCSAEYLPPSSSDPLVQSLYRSEFTLCLNLEKFEAEVSAPPAFAPFEEGQAYELAPERPSPRCSEAEIERLEEKTDERSREFDREWEKCNSEARRQNPGKYKTWIEIETENCVDDWLLLR